MYYDDESLVNYYTWYKQGKELERARKIKKKLDEARRKKLKKERERLQRKQEKIDKRQEEMQLKKEQKKQKLQELKSIGYKPTYTKQNPLKRNKNSRDLKLCQEIYEKAKTGLSTYTLAKEYDIHPNSVLRHKYEYQYYLGLKSIDKK
jgi:Skp family chaperone for outer membrane proteins